MNDRRTILRVISDIERGVRYHNAQVTIGHAQVITSLQMTANTLRGLLALGSRDDVCEVMTESALAWCDAGTMGLAMRGMVR